MIIDNTSIKKATKTDYLDTVTVMTDVKVAKYSPTKYFDNKNEASLFVLGMGLHTQQDVEAHNNITKGTDHIDLNDDTTVDSWSTDKKGELIINYGNDRITETEADTRDYIHTFLYGDNDTPGYGSSLFTPYKCKK